MERRIVRIWRAGDQLSVALVLAKISLRVGDASDKTHTLQNIQTDATKLIDVWVEDLCEESNLGRRHRVVFREEEFELEDAAWTFVSCRPLGCASFVPFTYLRTATEKGREFQHRNTASCPDAEQH